jgi:hypothetical protein
MESIILKYYIHNVYYTPKEPSALEVFTNSNWLEAMNQEMEAIYKNDIWSL